MRNNETGEYELVVGNKQLLSGFFLVVVLCAVSFAMGYVVGQNQPRSAKLAAEPAVGQDGRPQAASPALPAGPGASGSKADSASPPASQTDSAAANPPANSAAPPTEPPPPQPTTQPVRDTAASPERAPAAPEAARGSYWQVLATINQQSANDLLQTLKDKGFPVSLSPGPNNLTRVLVGPYTDTVAMGRAKTALENAGFHPVRK